MTIKTEKIFFLILMIAGILSVPAFADSGSWTVTLDADDANYRKETSEWIATTGWLQAGDFDSDMYDYESGLRFQTVGIPQGTTIINAYLEVQGYTILGNDPDLILSGEDADNTITFSTINDFTARPRTTATVAWVPTGWIDNTRYNSTDIKTIIQEIVDRDGWVSNNDMTIFVHHALGWIGSQERAIFYSYDLDNSKAPALYIEWTTYSDPDPPELLFGAGFNHSVPYVKLYWDHDLSDTDFFEIQNSTDKILWDTLGASNITEYIDYDVENGTRRYYRVRACIEQPDGWHNSTFTEINYEEVHFLSVTGGTPLTPCTVLAGNWSYPITSSVSITEGTYSGGNRSSLDFVDDDLYQVTEVVGNPGLCIRFNFTKINTTDVNINIEMYLNYTGSHEHKLCLNFWNFTGSDWVPVYEFHDVTVFHWYNTSISHIRSDDLLEEGKLWLRLCVCEPGNINHDVFIDYLRLRAFVPTGEIIEVDAWSINWLIGILWLGLTAIGVFKENKILIMFAGFLGIILGLLLLGESAMGSIALILLNLYLLYEGTQ